MPADAKVMKDRIWFWPKIWINNLSLLIFQRNDTYKAAKKHDHIVALQGKGRTSPWVLYRLGLYSSLTALPLSGAVFPRHLPLFRKPSLSFLLLYAQALGQKGAVSEAWANIKPYWSALNSKEKIAFCASIARWNPEQALTLLPRSALLERMSCQQHLQNYEELQIGLSAYEPLNRDNPEFLTLAVAYAAYKKHYVEARQLMNHLFSLFALKPMFKIDCDAPLLAEEGFSRTSHYLDPSSPPLISIIMAAYQTEATLNLALQRLLSQSWTHFEVLIVDDASQDQTSAIALKFCAQDSRVQYIPLTRRSGVYGARNIGLKKAKGSFITFADADDIFHPQFLEIGIQCLLKNPHLKGHISRLLRLTPEGIPFAPRVFPFLRLCPASLMIRASVIQEIGLFEEVPTGADNEYIGRMRAFYGPESIQKCIAPLILARHHPTSLTQAPESSITHRRSYEQRLAYWEEWHWRHVESAAQRIS